MTKEVARLSAESVGAVLGGLVGMSVGGPPGAVVGAAVAPWASAWVARSLEEFQARGATLGEAAAAAARLEQDEVVKKALEDPGLDPLVREILDAAARSDQIAALRVLGAILGDRTANGAPKIDEDVLITRAIAELQAPHIAVMDLLSWIDPRRKAKRRSGLRMTSLSSSLTTRQFLARPLPCLAS